MIFGLIMLILVGVIAFFHYTQGFFSATLSAIMAIFAASLAIGYHETLVNSLLQGKFADQANAIGLVVIFALVYIALRAMFDKFIPGNIRLPAIVDKAGAGVMGLIAGIFCVGIVAIAAQTLPFGPSVGMYSRYQLTGEREVVVPTENAGMDATISDEMKNDRFERADSRGMLLPVDDMVVGAVAYLSKDGSLAGDRALEDIHPSYVDEVFGNRLGIQIGAKRSALNLGTNQHVSVPQDGLFSLEKVAQSEGEIDKLRQGSTKSGNLTPKGNEVLLVVRTLFSKDATDNDNIFRFSPASARLVAGGENFYPVGTLEKGNLLLANRMDDYLVVEIQNDDKGADLVYLVDKEKLLEPGSSKGGTAPPTVKDGVFLEVKRLARVSLGGMKIEPRWKPSPAVAYDEKTGGLLRKIQVSKNLKPGGATAAGGAAGAGGPAPAITVEKIDTYPTFFTKINVGTPDKDANDIQLGSGRVALKEGKFSKLAIEATESITKMRTGSYGVDQLYVPPGKSIVQVVGRAPASDASDGWSWADQVGEFELVDSAGTKYKPNGAWCRVKPASGADRMLAQYDPNTPLTGLSHSEGRPTDLWIAYLVPSGTHIKSFSFKGTPVKELEQVVP